MKMYCQGCNKTSIRALLCPGCLGATPFWTLPPSVETAFLQTPYLQCSKLSWFISLSKVLCTLGGQPAAPARIFSIVNPSSSLDDRALCRQLRGCCKNMCCKRIRSLCSFSSAFSSPFSRAFSSIFNFLMYSLVHSLGHSRVCLIF